MYASPIAIKRVATLRMVVASFGTGVCFMLCLGLALPLTAKGALWSVRAAEASAFERQAPLIEPLDVTAIEAQLDAAEASVISARASTAREIARLNRLTRR